MTYLQTLSTVIFYLGMTGQGGVSPWYAIAPLVGDAVVKFVKEAWERAKEREDLRMLLLDVANEQDPPKKHMAFGKTH